METLWNSQNYVDKISFIAQWTVLISGIIALIFTMRSSTLKDHADSLKAKEALVARTLLEGKIQTANDDLNSTKRDLSSTKNELDKLRPRPLPERMRSILSSIDRSIIPTLKAGNTKFNGGITSTQFNELQKISKESGASKYLTISPDVKMGVGMGPEGVTYGVSFILNPQLLKD